MEYEFELSELVFKNDLIIQRLFTFVDVINAKSMRLVCPKLAEAGLSRFKRIRDKIYLKLKENNFMNLAAAEADKTDTVKWALQKDNDWILKKLKIPIRDGIISAKIKNFLEIHGHKITHLQLFRNIPDTIEIQLEESNSLIDSLHLIIYKILSRWCPNLEHFSITDIYLDILEASRYQISTFPLSNLKSLEFKRLKIPENVLVKRYPQDSSSFLAQIVNNSPNLKELKVAYVSGARGEGILSHFRRIPRFSSNIEILGHGIDADVSRLGYLTERAFPRLNKLLLNSEKQSCWDFNRPPPSPINKSVKEIVWTAYSFFEQSLPILLSLFPNVQKLTLKNCKCFSEYHTTYRHITAFPNVKTLKLVLKWDKNNMFVPKVLKQMLKLMSGVEKLEIAGLEESIYLGFVLQGIEGNDTIKELDISMGSNYWNWAHNRALQNFPNHLRISVHV